MVKNTPVALWRIDKVEVMSQLYTCKCGESGLGLDLLILLISEFMIDSFVKIRVSVKPRKKLKRFMEAIILVIHLVIVISLVLVILIQRTNSDGLSGLGGGAAGNALFSVRGKANVLTKITSFLALGLLITSLTLGYIANHKSAHTVVDQIATKPTDMNPADKKQITDMFNNKDAKPADAAKTDAAKPVDDKAAAKPAAPDVPLAK